MSPPADSANAGEHSAVSPGSRRLRVVVDRADNPQCPIAVGDYFEVHDTRLYLPEGASFCPHAFGAVAPVLALRQVDLPADHWLVRKPWVCCPDATENVVLRIDQMDDTEVGLAIDSTEAS